MRDHMESFQREEAFGRLAGEILQHKPEFRFRALTEALRAIAPEFAASLFVRRPCRRKLCYVGCTWSPSEPASDDAFFKLGEIYIATSFNGGTYEIEGYVGRIVGCAYFEYVDDA